VTPNYKGNESCSEPTAAPSHDARYTNSTTARYNRVIHAWSESSGRLQLTETVNMLTLTVRGQVHAD
jgi:hypothetical protein